MPQVVKDRNTICKTAIKVTKIIYNGKNKKMIYYQSGKFHDLANFVRCTTTSESQVLPSHYFSHYVQYFYHLVIGVMTRGTTWSPQEKDK